MTRLWQAYHKDITRIWQGYDKDMRVSQFHMVLPAGVPRTWRLKLCNPQKAWWRCSSDSTLFGQILPRAWTNLLQIPLSSCWMTRNMFEYVWIQGYIVQCQRSIEDQLVIFLWHDDPKPSRRGFGWFGSDSGLLGNNWKYLEYLEALWHRVLKPTTWQLAHDLSTQTERNPRCLILRDLEYHWCTKISGWSDSETAQFLAGNIWAYESIPPRSVKCRCGVQSSTPAPFRRAEPPRSSERLLELLEPSRRETSAQLERNSFLNTKLHWQLSQLSNMDFLCLVKGIKLTKKASLCNSNLSERWYSVRLFQLFQCFVIFSALLRWWRQWWWWGALRHGVTWSPLPIVCDCSDCSIMCHVPFVSFVSFVLWFAWHVLDISPLPVGVACGQAGLAGDLPWLAHVSFSLTVDPGTRIWQARNKLLQTSDEISRRMEERVFTAWTMWLFDGSWNDLDGFIMFYPEFAQTLTLTAEAESDDNTFHFFSISEPFTSLTREIGSEFRTCQELLSRRGRTLQAWFAHVCTVCSFCIWFDVCAIVHSCTEMLDEDLSTADLKGFCKRSKMRYILSFQNHDWNREQQWTI